jgi:hypothetical protein
MDRDISMKKQSIQLQFLVTKGRAYEQSPSERLPIEQQYELPSDFGRQRVPVQ